MKSSEQGTAYYAAFLFLIWPVLALTSAFKNYNGSWGKNILWAFVAFYGLCFAIGTESQGSDIIRYVDEVKMLHHEDLTLQGALDYYLQSGEVDIFRTLIALIVSSFTDSQVVLTLVFGIIFGFFFSRNMWYVLERLEGKIQLTTLLLFTCYFLVVPIWNMNGFRMWTATHIFLYGLLPYLFEGKRSGILFCMLAILMHFSFIVPVGILLGYMAMGNRLLLYFIFFVATFFISEINITVFNNLVENYAPEIVQERTSSYRSEDEVEQFRTQESGNQKVWYARYYVVALRWSVMGFLVVLYVSGKKFFKKNKKWLNLFSFTLFYYGVANLFSSLPSGGRFVAIGNLAALALITLYIQNREREPMLKRFILFVTPALALFVLVAFRIGLYSMSATSILGNPVLAMFLTGEHVSLNDFIKDFLL